MARKVGSKIFVWILLGMVIVGLIGFGSTNLGGTIRTIGSVGDKDLSINGYARALQTELRAFEERLGQSITFEQAQLFGIDQQVLARVITSRLIDAEVARMGVSVGDDVLREQLIQISSFQGLDGEFDREIYQLALENAGMNERDYEEQLRDEISSSLLQTSILSNLGTNPAYANAFAGYLSETRDITWAVLTDANLDSDIPAPTATEIEAFYNSSLDLFTVPETRQISYVWITPEMLIDTVELDQQSLEDAYARRFNEFNTEERRLVERLVYPDTASAQDAADRLAEGTVSFEALVAERGLELIDIDLGDVTKSDLGGAGEAVFASENLGVVGPAESSLGPALFRVNGVLAAQSTSFEEALPLLRDELAYDRARRVIDAMVTDLDDLLAAGATIEELGSDTELQFGQISFNELTDEGIARYAAFRAEAAAATMNDFPEINNLADGGVFALRLDAIDAAAPQPLSEVMEQAEAGWAEQKRLELLDDKANALKASLDSGGSFEELGLTAIVETGLDRRASLQETPADVALKAFELSATNETAIVQALGSIYLVRLDEIAQADLNSEDNQAIINAVEIQISNEIDQDVFQAFAEAVRQRTDIELNNQAIDAVHANFQ